MQLMSYSNMISIALAVGVVGLILLVLYRGYEPESFNNTHANHPEPINPEPINPDFVTSKSL